MRDDLSWLGSAVFKRPDVDPPITTPAEIRNAATIEHAMGGTQREDARAALIARRESREAAAQARSRRAARVVDEIVKEHRAPAAQETTTMAKRVTSTTEEKETRREALREYLREHGPTTRGGLIEALGYPEGERGYYQLRTDCEAIGAGSETRQGPVALADRSHEPVPRPRRKPRTALSETPAPTKRRPAPEAAEPVRPSLAAAAREALRQADREGAPLYLEHEFVAALHGRLVEAGL